MEEPRDVCVVICTRQIEPVLLPQRLTIIAANGR
jgi:hypothetical protein